MSSREFEYAALKAMACDITQMYLTGQLLAYANDNGLSVRYDEDAVVVYPERSTRKNPACVAICSYERSNFSRVLVRGSKRIYIYKAGDYDMARGREKASIRSEAKSSSLRAGQDGVHQQQRKRGVTALL